MGARTEAGAAFYHALGRAMRDALREGAEWDELQSALRKRSDQVAYKAGAGIASDDWSRTKDLWS